MPHIQWQTNLGKRPMRCHSSQGTLGQRLLVPETRWHRTARRWRGASSGHRVSHRGCRPAQVTCYLPWTMLACPANASASPGTNRATPRCRRASKSRGKSPVPGLSSRGGARHGRRRGAGRRHSAVDGVPGRHGCPGSAHRADAHAPRPSCSSRSPPGGVMRSRSSRRNWVAPCPCCSNKSPQVRRAGGSDSGGGCYSPGACYVDGWGFDGSSGDGVAA
jgi:hypothetical protein